MAGTGAVLASRILSEISSLGMVAVRVESAWKAAAANNDEFYFDSVALNILQSICWKPIMEVVGIFRHCKLI